MQIIRTIIWALILFVVVVFSYANWDRQLAVQIWDGLVWDTRLPAVVLVTFALGLIPMWIYHRGVRWTMSRKIASLESAARTNMVPPVSAAPGRGQAVEPPASPQPASRSQSESDDLKPEVDKP